MLVREGDRIIHTPSKYVATGDNNAKYGQVVIVDCITPEVLITRMQQHYSPGFARYIAYNGGMSTICDVVELASITGKNKPLLVKSANDAEFGCTGKIYAKDRI